MDKEIEIQAAVFRRLLAHLDSRKDVQNIELMNLAGFCRNCFSKWTVAEAEKLGVAVDIGFGVIVSRTAGEVFSDSPLQAKNKTNTNVGNNTFMNFISGNCTRVLWFNQLGLKHHSLKNLRTTYGTMFGKAGVEIKSLHMQMGHSRYATTFAYYNQPSDETMKEESSKLDGF